MKNVDYCYCILVIFDLRLLTEVDYVVVVVVAVVHEVADDLVVVENLLLLLLVVVVVENLLLLLLVVVVVDDEHYFDLVTFRSNLLFVVVVAGYDNLEKVDLNFRVDCSVVVVVVDIDSYEPDEEVDSDYDSIRESVEWVDEVDWENLPRNVVVPVLHNLLLLLLEGDEDNQPGVDDEFDTKKKN